MKKVLVGLFLAVFGLAMANVTLAANNDVMCTMQYDPVCGVDNKTYGNACVAGAEGVAVKHKGECTVEDTGPKACTKEYMPVCGYVDVQCVRAPCYPVAQTFGNRCEAENANATFITEGACKSDVKFNKLAGTAWELTTFNGEAVEGTHTLSFEDEKFGAKVCNHIGGEYTVDGSTIQTNNVITTLMLCTGPAGEYNAHFDLSGAKYEFATDGGNHLMITMADGSEYQWKSTNPKPGKPVQPNSWRRYGLIIRQLNQIAKLKGYDTVAEKQEMALDIIEKIENFMMVANLTPLKNLQLLNLKAGVQFYHDHVADGTFSSL